MGVATYGVRLLCCLVLLTGSCCGQSVSELQQLTIPEALDLSSDGERLWYKLNDTWWQLDTRSDSPPKRIPDHPIPNALEPLSITGSARRLTVRRSPDGKRIAYLDAETSFTPQLLYCMAADVPLDHLSARPVSRMPVRDFRWASDSKSLWVIGVHGADEPIGHMRLNGRFTAVRQAAALRSLDGLAAGGDVIAWVQSDGGHHGAIWVRDQQGKSRMRLDPNPQTSVWSAGWKQEVVRWKNAHNEELHGILVRPRSSGPFPLIVDPYSSRRNRFLNIPALGNYAFIRAGYAIFQPDHRAPYSLPAVAFGEAYVGSAKDRDPIDVLTDDVMSGVNDLIRRKIAAPHRLFLYSASNGASAIDQLLTQTHAFVAAFSYGGVSNWLGYYQLRHPLGDETIPGFLGGRTPQNSPALYHRISPLYQAGTITTPLLLVIGDQDTRYNDTMNFYKALTTLHRPASLIVYHGEGHELASAHRERQHVQAALDFFRSVQAGTVPLGKHGGDAGRTK